MQQSLFPHILINTAIAGFTNMSPSPARHVPGAGAKKYSWDEAIQNNSGILNKLNFTEQVPELM